LREPEVLLDTDTVSAITKRHPQVTTRASEYRRTRGKLSISIITRYEVLRGLEYRDALRQRRVFDGFCDDNLVLDLSEDIVLRAAAEYARLRRSGTPTGDLDLLLAATALHHGLVFVTNNTRHFERIEGLQLQNWMERS